MEKENNKEIKTESIGTSISSILLNEIKKHEEYMTLAKLGGVTLEEQEALNRNGRNLRKVRSLPRIISSQIGMIRVSLSIIKINSQKEWASQYPTQASKELNPFESQTNDYSSLVKILKLLRYCDNIIREAEWTNNTTDDFLRTIHNERENYRVNDKVLTKRFFDMLEELEESFVEIYGLLLKNGLITDITTERKKRSRSDGIY